MFGSQPIVSRRSLIKASACGFAQLALAGLAAETTRAATGKTVDGPLAPKLPHFRPRAKRIIFLFMTGGPPHMDTFDYKPLLQRDGGRELPFALPKLQQLQKRDL